MATDITRALKYSVILHLAADGALTAVVPAERIRALQVPSQIRWPFIRYGSPITTGFEATCWSGASNRVTLHAFAETSNAGAGEDIALDICALIVDRMKIFAPADLRLIENEWLSTDIVRDGDEADRWHAFSQFTITAVPA
ncbi:DUF3168 domain-containing protein [Nitratireductor sp. GCM10026969]|uniref:DUF3168 domain-containing protein n=1 Tax=Nitratireductor sp. GCM10026969 TaxID=3252645 RepID=UPI00361A80D0